MIVIDILLLDAQGEDFIGLKVVGTTLNPETSEVINQPRAEMLQSLLFGAMETEAVSIYKLDASEQLGIPHFEYFVCEIRSRSARKLLESRGYDFMSIASATNPERIDYREQELIIAALRGNI